MLSLQVGANVQFLWRIEVPAAYSLCLIHVLLNQALRQRAQIVDQLRPDLRGWPFDHESRDVQKVLKGQFPLV